MLRKKDPGLLKLMADKISSHVNELAVEHTNRLVKKEIMAYAANENCQMKKSSAKDLHKFHLLISSCIRHKAVSDIHYTDKTITVPRFDFVYFNKIQHNDRVYHAV